MAINQLQYTQEEFAQRGNEIYESQVRPKVEEGNRGKIVAIDIETGTFELAKDAMTASKQLLEKAAQRSNLARSHWPQRRPPLWCRTFALTL